MGLFDSFSADSNRQIARQTEKKQLGQINQGQKDAQGNLRYTMRQAVPAINRGVEAFTPFQANGVQGSNMYSNALGLNGQGGYDAATGAFHNSPGFQFALDQANQNILRNQAQTGALNSGNTLAALGERAQGLQNQEWNNWLANLAGLAGQGLQGAGGMASGLTNLANLWQNQGENMANLNTGAATNRANIYGQTGQNVANANNTANSNQWGAILGLLNAGAQGLGAA